MVYAGTTNIDSSTMNSRKRRTNAARLAIMPACLGIVFGLAVPAISFAQTATVSSTLNPAFYAVPADMKLSCAVSASDPSVSPTCPVVRFKGITTWAYNMADNRASLGIVSYDASGTVVMNQVLGGAQSVYKITSEVDAKTVTFWGAGDAKIVLPWSSVGPPQVYKWVSRATPPPNAVFAPDPPHLIVCKGMGLSNSGENNLLVGYWDGSHCLGYTGTQVPVLKGLQFLASISSGGGQWRSGLDPLPANAINAGINPFNSLPMFICSESGFVGYDWNLQGTPFGNSCTIGSNDLTPGSITVLVGTVQ